MTHKCELCQKHNDDNFVHDMIVKYAPYYLKLMFEYHEIKPNNKTYELTKRVDNVAKDGHIVTTLVVEFEVGPITKHSLWDGKTVYVLRCLHSMKHGKCEYIAPKINMSCQYFQGKKNGLLTKIVGRKSYTMKKTYEYVNSVKHGISIAKYAQFNEESKNVCDTTCIGEYKDDRLLKYTTYEDSAKKSEILYNKNGHYHGLCKYWHSNGNLKKEIEYDDNIESGKYINYANDGTVLIDMITNKNVIVKINSLKDKSGRNHLLSESGEITGYKVCETLNNINVIVELIIPAGTKRKNTLDLDNFECVAEYVIVKRICDKDNNEYKIAKSFMYDATCKYIVGEKVIPDKYDPNDNSPGREGIHFYNYPDQCNKWIAPLNL